MIHSSDDLFISFFFHDPATTDIYTLSLHDALPICFVDSTYGPRCRDGCDVVRGAGQREASSVKIAFPSLSQPLLPFPDLDSRLRARQRATRCRNRSRLLPASSYPSLVPFQNEGGNPTGIRRSPFRIPVCFFICMLPPNPPNRQSLTSPERTSFFCAGQVQTTEERKDKRSNAHEQRTLT